jgi:hypothetical protein
VTATKKLFLAAILLAVGFGVARLMGVPDAPWHVSLGGGSLTRAPSDDKLPVPNATTVRANTPANDARLVPDYSSDNPYRVRADVSAPPQVQSSLSEMTVSNGTTTQPSIAFSGDHQPSLQNFEPRIKLRDEAPRPLDFESRAAATVYSSPAIPLPSGDNPPVAAARTAAADWRASGLSPAEFVSNSVGAATINASYSHPAETPTNTPTVAPPPWFEPAEASGPRTHVVVDGDSLERLAGRYLDDSSRGREIYEANRELLASPDLLPIGAELVIPEQKNRAAFEATSPQSSLASDPPLRAATNGIDRFRPIPPAPHVLPRAQLLQPVRVD